MRAAIVVARRILRQRLRDRSAILFAVLTPLFLALAFAAIIPDFTPTFHTTILVVDQDGGPVAGLFATTSSAQLTETRHRRRRAGARCDGRHRRRRRRPGGRRDRDPGRASRAP